MAFLANFAFLSVLLQFLKCYYIVKMEEEEQIEKFSFKVNDDDYSYASTASFSYGLWSRYTPLSQILQVGPIGLFDSTCFHYHNAADEITKNINFIYYDCLDFANNKVTKYIKFIDESNQKYIIEKELDINQYEYTWYYFQIIVWPLSKKFQLTWVRYPYTLLRQELQVKYPYIDKNLVLTFGGGLNGYYDSTLVKYSYFPGKMYLYKPEQTRYAFTVSARNLAVNVFYYLTDCQCEMNSKIQVIASKKFKKQDIFNYISQKPNCDYFQLSGWLKISEIVKYDVSFIYHIMKVTTNSKNQLLTNKNLSPFNLYYDIGETLNKIIFSSYSYTFPSVKIDFQSDPYLIIREFEIKNNIYLWHYFSVILQNNQLSVGISFYDGVKSYDNKYIFQVKQFHIVQFNIQLGNLNGYLNNYINFEANQVQFTNCAFFIFVQACNFKCETCDGPTEFDCISCPQDRIYLPHTKSCVCPYNSFDNSWECLTMDMINLNPVQSNEKTLNCQYGYFLNDEKCIACPSSINSQQISCTECLMNPKTWQNMLYCLISFVSNDGQSYKIESTGKVYFIYDGQDVNFCEYCNQICTDDNCLYQDRNNVINREPTFCSSDENEYCLACNILYCNVCMIKQNQMTCDSCIGGAQLVDGKCDMGMVGGVQQCKDQKCAYCISGMCQSCYSPYYITQDRKECKECTIKNCIYCFIYQTNDLTQNTLQKDFIKFENNENTRIGCSKCQDGFNFDFTIGECIYKESSIQNCSNYFIDLQGKEVCLLSSIDDFNISPQITNCQKQISNCVQCLATNSLPLKCIICENGYKASISTGLCELCEKQNALVCTEGNFRLQDGWVQLIQSFLVQFLPDNYFYPRPSASYYIQVFPIKCIDGYYPSYNYQCIKYCDSNCLQCEQDSFNNNYICQICPSNYYGEPNLSSNKESCLSCPVLCLACQIRSSDEIKQINPFFTATSDNLAYSYKCLRVIQDSKVFLDPDILVASYCLDEQCNQNLEFEQILTCDNIGYLFYLEAFPKQYYEKQINTDYCNQMGIKFFTLRFLFELNPYVQSNCVFNYVTNITTSLKTKVFSLQYTKFVMQGNKQRNSFFWKPLIIDNFDYVQLTDMIFQLSNSSSLQMHNQDLPIDLNISNSLFFGSKVDSTKSQIYLTHHRDLILQNVTFGDLQLKDTIFFNYQSNSVNTQIEFYQITLFNCIFENTILFSFLQYSSNIKISVITIRNSTFINSTIFQFNQSNLIHKPSYLDNIYLESSIFQHSMLVNNQGSETIYLHTFELSNCTLSYSIVINSQANTYMKLIDINNSILYSSTFFQSTLQTSQLTQSTYSFVSFQIGFNNFTNSNLFLIHQSDSSINKVSVFFNEFQHAFLGNSDKTYKSLTYVYDIECEELVVSNFFIQDTENLPIIRIFYTNTAMFDNISFKASQQSFKVSSLSSCYQDSHYSPILLHVQGFAQLTLNNFNIVNQFSIDYSLIHILSDILYTPRDKEILQFSNISFYGNLLLKNNLGNIFSLLVIYSDRLQEIRMYNISFEENFFNQQVDDPSQTTASLMFIISQQSSVQIDKIMCQQNGLTNSSYSFITINSLSTNFNQFNVKNSNYLQNQIWMKYYQINADISMPNQLFNQAIQQLFKIQNKGGVGQFAASTIIIINSEFNSLIAQTNSVFSLTTQGEGIIKLINITISNASVLLFQPIELDGGISIYSKSSLLHLTMQNVLMESIKNRLGPALLSIYPSQKQNIINLQNLTVYNCISLINQFFTVEFSQESIQNNEILISRLNITFTEAGWSSYLEEISFPSIAELKKIMADNSIMNIHDCSFTLDNFYITGILISPIMILTDIQKLVIRQIIFRQFIF